VKAGELVYISSQGSRQVDARKLSTLGTGTGNPSVVADATHRAGDVGIAATASGWIATWVGAAGSPNTVEVVVLDSNLAVTAGPFSGNPTTYDPARLRVSWAKDANVYIAIWHAKNNTNDDDIWIQLFDNALHPIGMATIIANFSYAPSVATDGSSFWVVWNNYKLNALETVRISGTGDVSARTTVMDSGGNPRQWALFERAGQVVLVWTEVGGSGGDLYLSAVCP
jgi:hypothetical protein